MYLKATLRVQLSFELFGYELEIFFLKFDLCHQNCIAFNYQVIRTRNVTVTYLIKKKEKMNNAPV